MSSALAANQLPPKGFSGLILRPEAEVAMRLEPGSRPGKRRGAQSFNALAPPRRCSQLYKRLGNGLGKARDALPYNHNALASLGQPRGRSQE